MTKYDVVLIYPKTSWDIKNITTRLPLSVLYIGSVLQGDGFSVKIIDQRVDEDWRYSLIRAVEGKPLWVGVGPMTGRQINYALDACRLVRKQCADIPIVWGGVHATSLPEQTLNHPLVDIVVIGEGEITALELTKALSRKDFYTHSLREIKGLAWKENGVIIRNQNRSCMDMNDLPPLDYGLVNVENYILAEVPKERSLQITTSRGCPRRCAYCYLSIVPDGRQYRTESPERTVKHIERIMKSYEINAVHIIDDEFFTQRKRAVKICELIIARNIKVTLRTNCRIDYIDNMSLEELVVFRRAGFKHLYLGAESGSDRVLNLIKKDISRNQIIRVNRKLKQADIIPKYSFMGGFPDETIHEVKETLRLMDLLTTENSKAYTTPIQLFSPYPGTELYDLCVQQGMPSQKSLDEWGDTGWEHIDYSTLNADEQQFFYNAAYFTFFLDGKTVSESMHSRLMQLAAILYGRWIRFRIRSNFYRFMPEVRLIKSALSRYTSR